MSRVLLINPNWTGISSQQQIQFKRLWQPLCLANSAAMLEKAGHFVRLADNNVLRLSPLALGSLAKGFDAVFITSTPYDRWQCPALDIGFFIDSTAFLPKKRLYIMGAHVTERPLALLEATGARAAILGEPEQTISAIVEQDIPQDRPFAPIEGCAWVEEGLLQKAPQRPWMENLDEMPYPAFHLLPMSRYHYFPAMGHNFALLEASRGCPVGCTFCYLGMYGPKVRRKEPMRFLDEVDFVARRFGVKNFYFMDLEFCLSRRFVEAFCLGMIKRRIKANWTCQTRVTDMDLPLARLMRCAGCSLIHFGVESGDEKVLAATKKGISRQSASDAVRACRRAGIRTALFFNFGFPNETKGQMETTLQFACELNPTFASFHLVVPFPGTALAEQTGTDPKAFPPGLYPQYNFACHGLPALKAMLNKAYLKFYLRPQWAFAFLSDSHKASKQIIKGRP
ncbi:MAG: radical SAM protein [Desulfatibacillaceae bacterium]|nr:radical SAM protein [Desulfatibacillaceae bacterium]